MSRLNSKINGLVIRFSDAIRWFPLRLKRLFFHFFTGIRNIFQPKESVFIAFTMWWSELVYILLDLFAIPEIYETLQDLVKFNSRPMTQKEIEIAQTIFGNSINYERVRIDEKAQIGCRHFRFLYVRS